MTPAVLVFQILVSILTIASTWLMGNKTITGPIVSVVCQVVWVAYAIISAQYLLLPAILGIGFVAVRNWIKWAKENKH